MNIENSFTKLNMQVNCTQAFRCDFEAGVAPIPVPEDNSVGFFLHLNFLGEPQAVSGPMEIGDTISIQCLEPGKFLLTLVIFYFELKTRLGVD